MCNTVIYIGVFAIARIIIIIIHSRHHSLMHSSNSSLYVVWCVYLKQFVTFLHDLFLSQIPALTQLMWMPMTVHPYTLETWKVKIITE